MNIFLSYGHDNNEWIVKRIKSDLEADDHKVWIDKEEIKAGEDWRKKIYKALLGTDFVVSFASEHSVRDPGVCLDELAIAVSVKGALVQSILLESSVIPPANISYRQFIDMSSWAQHREKGDFESWYQDKLREIKAVINSPETRQYAEEIEYLREKLNPDLSAKKKSSLEKQMYSDREWLSNLVEEWEKSDDRFLVIEGSPGSGKSSFVSHEFLFNDEVGGVIYCEWDNPYMNNLDSISRTLIFQLAAHLTDFRYNVIQLLKNSELSISSYRLNNDVGIFHQLLVAPLRQLIDGERPRTIIIIDGLDEVSQQEGGGIRTRNSLAEILAREGEYFPNWIKFIVTTRPDPKVLKPLNKYRKLSLDDYRAESLEDVKRYLDLRLKNCISADDIELIRQKSAGNFLYAKMLADALISGDITPEEIDSSLSDLSSIYTRNFDRIFHNAAEFDDFYYPALCMIGYSESPIPKSTLMRGMGWHKRQLEIFMKCTAQYLAANNDYIGFYHKSLYDWLKSDEAEEYIIDREIGIARIADGCYSSYMENCGEMLDYECLNILAFLEMAGKTEQYEKVLHDLSFADLLTSKSNQLMEQFRYLPAKKLIHDAALIYESNERKDIDTVRKSGEIYILAAQICTRDIDLDECLTYCSRGIDFLSESMQSFPAVSEIISDQLGTLYLKKAQTERIKALWDMADYSYDQSYQAFLHAGNEHSAMEALNAKALAYRVRGQITDALDCYHVIETIPSWQSLKEEALDLYMIIQMSLGWCLHGKGDFHSAYAKLHECETLFEENPYSLAVADIAQLFYILSLITYSLADYEKSYRYAERSFDYVRKAYGEKAVETCNSINQMGNILLREGRIREAIGKFEESVERRLHYYGKENIYTAISMRNLGRAKMQSGAEEDLPDAEQLLKEVLEIREKIIFRSNKNKSEIAQSLLDLAELYEAKGEFDRALQYADQAEEIYLNYHVKRNLGTCYMVKGRILCSLCKMQEAKKYLENALAIQTEYYSDTHPYIIRIRECLMVANSHL